jgi:hypothetical protein
VLPHVASLLSVFLVSVFSLMRAAPYLENECHSLAPAPPCRTSPGLTARPLIDSVYLGIGSPNSYGINLN